MIGSNVLLSDPRLSPCALLPDPNIVFDQNNTDGQGAWRCWYGDCVKGCGSQILLYANSSDGLQWEKPDLGLFDVKEVRPDLASIGTKNNIIMKGGGLGIYKVAIGEIK